MSIARQRAQELAWKQKNSISSIKRRDAVFLRRNRWESDNKIKNIYKRRGGAVPAVHGVRHFFDTPATRRKVRGGGLLIRIEADGGWHNAVWRAGLPWFCKYRYMWRGYNMVEAIRNCRIRGREERFRGKERFDLGTGQRNIMGKFLRNQQMMITFSSRYNYCIDSGHYL